MGKNELHGATLTRRSFLRFGAATASCFYLPPRIARAGEPVPASLLNVDHEALVSLADLHYEIPVRRPVEGQPIGNGRMGTLVWTRPEAVHFQINRADVFAVNRNHGGKREGRKSGRNTPLSLDGAADYCGGCARLTVAVGGAPFSPGEGFRQQLSLYRAESTIDAPGVQVRCFVTASDRVGNQAGKSAEPWDVLVVQVADSRTQPQPLQVTLSMWRDPEVKIDRHVARYRFRNESKTVLLAQQFEEGDFHCASAVAATLVDAESEIVPIDDKKWTIRVPAGKGTRTILVSSAASWDALEDAETVAKKLIHESVQRGTEALSQAHRRWWQDFWSRTFMHLESADGVAQFMGRLRYLQLYVMASSSRGALPPKWNGSIFAVDGDRRNWGAQFWVWTTEISYFPLYAADAVELTDPFFDMYVQQLPAAKKAAMQRWGVEGAYFLEAGPFDGPVVLPDKIAAEYQDVYLGRKTIEELSAAARALGQYECVLSQFADGREFRGEAGRYSYVSHIASSGSEVAAQAWWRYRYEGEEKWLATHAYPLLKGTVEFYRGLTGTEEALQLKKTDGKYHFYGLNQHEGYWGVNDGLIDLAAVRGTVPLAIRAARTLAVDAALRAEWRDLLANLSPYPMGSDSRSVGVAAADIWSVGHKGPSNHVQADPGEGLMWPIFPFEDWTLETREPAMDRVARKSAQVNSVRMSILTDKPWGAAIFGSATRTPILGSRTGRGEDLPAILASYYFHYKPLPNGFSEFEGPTAHSIEHLGSISMAINEGLLQSVAPKPGEPEIISVFPAWPKAWNASFRLLARGGFLVTASIRDGAVRFVEIESRRGESCRLRNPWKTPCEKVVVSDQHTQERRVLGGAILRFETKPGQRVRLLPHPAPAVEPSVISPRQTIRPARYELKLPGGKVVCATLGLKSD